MPIKKCIVGGKNGWKYGDDGHCYIGPDGKKKAIQQGVAIEKNRGGSFHASIKDSIFETVLAAMSEEQV